MKEKIAKMIEYSFLVLLICQIGGGIFFNLSDIRYSLDTDLANTFYHIMEVIENGTIKLPDWKHTTTLELDGSFLFAIPTYHIIKNIFLSVGISNIILMVLYLFTVSRILYHFNVKRVYIYITLCLVVTPYSFGMLEYFNMMFFGGACYSIKTLVPLLFLLLIQLLSKEGFITKAEKIELIFTIVTYAALLFVTVFSTGFYTVFCGIFPFTICMILDIWLDSQKQQKYNKRHLGLLVGSFIIFLAGYILHKNFYPYVSRTNMRLTKIENYAINFRACIAGIFQVFGAVTSEDIEALSFWGIVYCLKIGLVILMLISFVYNLTKILRRTDELDIKKYLSFIFLFNFLLLVVADSRFSDNLNIEYRYYLIGAVPLILLLGIQLEEWIEQYNLSQQKTVTICIFAALAVILAGNNKKIIESWDRTAYAVELCEYFNTLDIDSVFFMNDADTAVICKGIDRNRKYGAFMTDTQTLNLSICSYNQSASGSFYGSRNVLAVIEGNDLYDLVPAQIADNYTKIGSIRWYDIYYSDMVYFP